MPEQEWLADKFEENRGHLRAVAYRMLGSHNEASPQNASGCGVWGFSLSRNIPVPNSRENIRRTAR